MPKSKFIIRPGVPEVRDLWDRLFKGLKAQTLGGDDRELAKRLAKAVKHLALDPRHPGLQSHEIDKLTERYGQKVFQSYLENHTPSAGRLFWVYGPNRREITLVAVEPHPEDSKRGAYDRIPLSDLPPD
jgi:hypothetical protein